MQIVINISRTIYQFVREGKMTDLDKEKIITAFQNAIELPKEYGRRKGHWIRLDDYHMGKFECSECHTQGYVNTCMYEPKWNFCPNCGACMKDGRTLDEFIEDMRGDTDDSN